MPDPVNKVDEDSVSSPASLPFCWVVLGSSIHHTDHTLLKLPREEGFRAASKSSKKDEINVFKMRVRI